MEAGTSVQSPLVSLASYEAPPTVTSLRNSDLPDFSILTKGTDETPLPTSNGASTWGPVSPPTNGVESLDDSVDETAVFRARIHSLRDECNKLKQANKRLEREKQDAIISVEAHENSKADLTEKKFKLERENDDYLRNIVSANKKVDFFEKNLREMRLKCQEYEEILRQHGLLPGSDGTPLPGDSGTDAALVTRRDTRNQLEQLLTAQYIKLDTFVRKSGRPQGSCSQFTSGTGTKMLPMPNEPLTVATASQGARQKTRPLTLLETSEETWPSLAASKPGPVDPTGTKAWLDAQQRTRWMPEDDRSLNPCERQFKEMRLDNWIRALPRPEFSETAVIEEKDYVMVPKSADLPTSNPNSGCQTFPKLRVIPERSSSNPQPSILEDLRGSIAPVHTPCFPTKYGQVSEDNRHCPVCDMEFSDVVPLLEVESHVADCCEQASCRDLASPPLNSPVMSPLERKCPVCSGDFSSTAQKEFESHVESHFEEDLGAAAPSTPDVLDVLDVVDFHA